MDRGLIKGPNTWVGSYDMLADHPAAVYRFRYNCTAPLCFYSVMVASEKMRDERAASHQCPWYGGGSTTLSWSIMSDEYLAPIWKLLDAEVDIIKARDVTEEAKRSARTSATAYANTLALLMQPFFTTPKEIAEEAIARWQARVSGNTEYCTAGLGRLKWKRPGGAVGDPSHPSWVTREYDPNNLPEVRHNLTDEQVAAIRAARGMPLQMLVAAYGVEAKVILALQKG